jgi:hypothetical protein
MTAGLCFRSRHDVTLQQWGMLQHGWKIVRKWIPKRVRKIVSVSPSIHEEVWHPWGKGEKTNYGGLINFASLITVSAVQLLSIELVTVPTSKAFGGHVSV